MKNIFLLLTSATLLLACQTEVNEISKSASSQQVQQNNTNDFNTLYSEIQNDYANELNSDSIIGTIEVVKIGEQTWMKYNLDTDHFRNGDKIQHAKTPDEWRKCCDQNIPAWCYMEFYEKEMNKAVGKLYNESVVNDSRGILPNGWRIPNTQDWTLLTSSFNLPICNMKSRAGWLRTSIGNCGTESPNPNIASAKFTLYPVGYRLSPSAFAAPFEMAFLWTLDGDNASVFNLTDRLAKVSFVAGDKYKGINIRGIKSN